MLRSILVFSLLILAASLHASEGGKPKESDLVPIQLKSAAKIQNETGAMSIDIGMSVVNNSPEPIACVVVAINAFDEAQNPVTVNIHLADGAHPGSTHLPYMKEDGVSRVIWFSPPLKPIESKDATVRVPVPAGKDKSIKSIALHAAGYGDQNYGASLLGNPVLSEEERKSLSRTITNERILRFRYLTDSGAWVKSENGEKFPDAPDSQQSAGSGVKFQTTKIQSPNVEVVVANTAQQAISITVMGNGKTQTVELAASSEKTLTIDPGLYSFTASSPNTTALNGVKSWEGGTRQSWRFWIARDK